ncbi:MAG: D-alanyl-D-alanine carboxypeptidase/D-alanyl-D-alanine endopeptidase [Verrucomicrobiales bacterium]
MNQTAFVSKTLVLLVVASASFSADGKEGALAGRIAEVINAQEFKTAHWGILLADQETGKTLYEHNAGKLFTPASVTKLFSVAAALDAFGPDHRFETSVYRRGEVADSGELKGDLILVAGGDLTLGGRSDKEGRLAFTNVDHTYANDIAVHALTEPDPVAGLNELARQIASIGIKRIRGDVVIDDRLFEKGEGDSGASGPTRLTPIMVNDNVIDFLITPAKDGQPAAVEWRPKTAALVIDVLVETGSSSEAPDIKIASPAAGRMVVRGRIPESSKPLVRIREVDDPAGFARALFIEALGRCGVAGDASLLAANRTELLPPPRRYRSEERVALLPSLPFSEEARLVLKVSHNLHASAVPLLVAVKHGRQTLADGLRLQHDFLARAGVDVDTISFADGVGGSRGDCTTPLATVQLLRYMATRPDFAAYEQALPILGEDGTLATTVAPNSPARGRVRAKTGTLYWENTMNGGFLLMSKALAGYLTTAKGNKFVFAMFVNNVLLQKSTETARVGAVLGRLCEIICEHQ